MSRPTPVATRILVVLHDLSLGGTERIALRLADAWSGAGRRVTVLCGDPRGPSAALLGPGVELVGADPATPRGPGAVRRLAQATARRLAAHPADVLFAPGNHHWPVIPAAAGLAQGSRPVLVAQVSNPMRRPDRGLLRQALFDARARRLLAGIDAAVTLTAAEQVDVDAILRRPVATTIPLPALDDQAPAPTPRRGGPPVVLCVGRLVAQKRFDLAIRAFARLSTPGVRLRIAGEGPWRARLERSAADLGVADRVEILGYVADVRAELDRASLLLITSRYEGYAAVVIEALAAGRPVVSAPGIPAALDLLTRPERGALAASRDPSALADAMARILRRPAADPAELAAAVAGRRMEPIARAYLDLFDRLRSRPAPL